MDNAFAQNDNACVPLSIAYLCTPVYQREPWNVGLDGLAHAQPQANVPRCANSTRIVQLWGIDCKAYYRVHVRQTSELWRNAVATFEGIQVDERCCFGSEADATKCSRVSNYLAWRVRRAIRAVDAQYPCRLACVLEWQQRRAASRPGGWRI